MKMDDKELLKNQIGLFFKQDFQGSLEELSLALKKVLVGNIGTQILNLPPTAPPEIPRLILNFPDIDINFAKNRIDIFSTSYVDNSDNIQKIINIVINDFKVSIGRIGFVANYFFNGEVETLKMLFLPEKMASLKLKEIGIRVNTNLKIDAYNCNNIQDIQNGEIKNGLTSKQGLIVMRDINTLTQDLQSNNFDFLATTNFINKANLEAEKLLIS